MRTEKIDSYRTWVAVVGDYIYCWEPIRRRTEIRSSFTLHARTVHLPNEAQTPLVSVCCGLLWLCCSLQQTYNKLNGQYLRNLGLHFTITVAEFTAAQWNYTVSQKSSHRWTLCQILLDFQNFCTAGKRTKCATKLIQHYPPQLRHVATLPWEIKNSNFLQIFSRYGRKCKQIAFQEITHVRNSSVNLFAVYPIQIQSSYQNLVLLAEYHVDCWQTLRWGLLWWISATTNWSQM